MLLRASVSLERVRALVALLLYTIYYLLHQIQRRLVQVYRRRAKTDEIPRGQVRLQSIVWRYKRDPEEISRIEDFVLLHQGFADLSVLDSPHWHIYTLDQSEVHFVLLPRPIADYSISRMAFMFESVFHDALLVGTLSRRDFVEMAGRWSVEGAKKRTVLYTNTARCGSTLLGQMLDRPGHSICWGEPHALSVLSIGLHEGTLSEQDVTELVPAVIEVLRRPVPDSVLCVLKTTSCEARLVPFCAPVVGLRHVFMFRKRGLASVEKMLRREPISDILYWLYCLWPWAVGRLCPVMACEGLLVRQLQPNTFKKLAAIVYASPYSQYVRNKDDYCHPTVWLHELLADTDDQLQSLFKSVGLPASTVEDAVKCKARDSQEGTFLSSSQLRHIQIVPPTVDELAALSHYAQFMGIPEHVLTDN